MLNIFSVNIDSSKLKTNFSPLPFPVFLFAFLFIPSTLLSNHLVGGELTYECLGGDEFEISLKMYRDCDVGSTGVVAAAFDDPAIIWIYDSNDNLLNVFELSFNNALIEAVPPDSTVICIASLPEVCVESYVYKETLTLEPLEGGYKVFYQRCCRSALTLNIPQGTGSTYEVFIPHFGGSCNNSSPNFNGDPPIVLCQDTPFELDFSASDLDGDSLVYEICTPFDGAVENNPAPSPPLPYAPLQWNNGFDSENQLGIESLLEINAETGMLKVEPAAIGLYAMGICVSEYRNGEFLSRVSRDFLYEVAPCELVVNVEDCPESVPIGIADQEGLASPLVYPNPVHSKLSIESQKNISSLLLRNINGDLIYEGTPNSANHTIDMSIFPNGLYFLSTTNKDGTQFQKILKRDH